VALGGQQKASIAVCNGAVAALGPHVGDLDSLATLARFEEHLGSLRSLYRIAEGSLFVSDLHPDFASRTLVERRGLATFPVQHHHAHLCAALLEAGWLDREVLGVAFDGAGLGTDGTVWGGEFLRATARGYRRMARLRPFPLLGGDAAVREPWRVAFALVARALGAGHPLCHQLASQAGARSTALEHLAAIPALAPRTSSAGRLFDGVAALTLGAYEAGFEGYPAMLLEHACDPQAAGAYELPLCEENAALLELDWRPLVRAVVHDRARGEPPPAIAMRFHRGLADAIAVVVNRWPNLPVVLAGGVFQNRLLTELAAERLEGRQVALPGLIPPGDGGLAAGQLVIGLSATALRNPSEN
jgi:hydrogenase maturation protein HypF